MDLDEEKKPFKLIIGTPSYDGKLDAWYVNSLIQTIKLSYEKNVDITTIWVSYDALIQRARNDTIAIAKTSECDALLFIDSDIEWDPAWVFEIIEKSEDVIGIPYPKKNDESLQFPIVKEDNNWDVQPNGLIEVAGIGTGFLKLSKAAINALWSSSPEYSEPGKSGEKRMVFDIGINTERYLVSEDLMACWKLSQQGFKIWIDPSKTCAHNGFKKYMASFSNYVKGISGTSNISKDFDDDTII